MGKQSITQHLLKAAAPYRAVAFDVFDTLIRRDCAQPGDLFALMEEKGPAAPGFAGRRAAAEKEARAMGKAGGKNEVTLAEIYARPVLAGADPQAECDAELRAAVPNLPVMEAARACHARGQLVYAVSDMYLPAPQIRAMLERCGCDFLDGIFVSCAYGTQKRSGGLFRVFLQETGLSPRQVLFVGDDARADFAGAALAGIRGYLLPPPERSGGAGKETQPVSGAVDAFVRNRAGQFSEQQRYGFSLLGPLVTAFAVWLHGQRQAMPGARLVFLARDMYFVRQAYGVLYPEEQTEYLRVSRQSLLPALLQLPMEGETLELAADALPRQMLTRGEIQRYLGFELPPQPEDGTVFDLRIRPLPPEVQALLRELSALSKTPAGANVWRQGRLVRSYLEDRALDRGTVILVDIGSGGTTQRALERLTGAALQGRYLACDDRLSRHIPPRRAQAFLFDGAPADLWYWAGQPMLELFLSESCGPTVGYGVENGVIRPVSKTGNNTEQPGMAELHRGMMAFPNEWKASFLNSIPIPPHVACKGYLDLVRAPRLREAAAFGGLRVEDGGTWTLAQPRSRREYLCHPAALKRDFAESRWKTAFLKRLFCLPLPYDCLYAAMKKRKGR